MVERVSGIPLDEFIRTRITAPLGMSDTHFFLPADKRERLAAVYASGSNGVIVRAPAGSRGQGDYVEGPRRSFAGGAGLLSTARDYARFLEMIRNGGALDGVRLLAPQDRAADDHQPDRHAALHNRPRLRLWVSRRPTGTARTGWTRWARSGGVVHTGRCTASIPQARLAILLMIQLVPNATDIREKFPTLVYQALVETSH